MADDNPSRPPQQVTPGSAFGEPALPLLVFTDLDGTLLDHDDYSFDAALPALRRLAQLRIPLIAVTSKTLAELRQLRRELDNHHPCIAENGGLIAVPHGYFAHAGYDTGEAGFDIIRLSASRTDILAALRELRAAHGYRFRGFADMSDAEVAACTGLDTQRARDARRRLCTEPLLWDDSEPRLDAFRRALAARGLQLVSGGRFLHVSGGHDKADAMRRLCALYRDNGLASLRSVALGDSPNDLNMLAAADIAVVMRPKRGEPLRVQGGEVQVSELPGPRGWNLAVQTLLDRFQSAAGAAQRSAAP